MTLSLRQKRRQETALHIQRATLDLAMEKGLENVTTEEIAIASGISTRTFFNYYPNKEAAAVGHPPTTTKEENDALRTGTGPVAKEIKQLLDRRMVQLSEREDILGMIGTIMRSNEKARGILEGHLAAERREITQALHARLGNKQTATALANSISSAIGGAIMLWQQEKDLSLSAALDVIWNGMMDASRILLTAMED